MGVFIFICILEEKLFLKIKFVIEKLSNQNKLGYLMEIVRYRVILPNFRYFPRKIGKNIKSQKCTTLEKNYSILTLILYNYDFSKKVIFLFVF